jgi:hypothetical protein
MSFAGACAKPVIEVIMHNMADSKNCFIVGNFEIYG